MAYNFKTLHREQIYLMPPSLTDWLPPDHFASFVLDIVDQLDLADLYGAYRQDGVGNSAYNPAMMLSVLFYAYAQGERSSRRIEALCHTDIAFRLLSANQTPDHTSLSRFRQRHQSALSKLFVQALALCQKAGLVRVGVIALDGSKVSANAALAANRTTEALAKEVGKILAQAEATDASEDQIYGPTNRGDELPAGLRQRASRLARLRECQEQLKKEAAAAQAPHQAKVQAYQHKLEQSGKRPRGRPPMPTQAKEDKVRRANPTDPESRVQKNKAGHLQGYNPQLVVSQDQIILAAQAGAEQTDYGQLCPMLKQTRENLRAAHVKERPKVLVADAGYWSESNAAAGGRTQLEVLLGTSKDYKRWKGLREQCPPRGRIPHHLNAKERMQRKLQTKRGRRRYALRRQTVEPVFGQIKEAMKFRRFSRRGQEAVQSEWRIICTVHNLLKLWRYQANQNG